MDIIYDAETAGGFNQHHPDFRSLFFGWMDNTTGQITQDLHAHPKFQVSDIAVGHNEKYDRKCFRQQRGYELLALPFDTKVAFHLIREDLSSYKLEWLSQLCGYPFPNYKQLIDFDDPEYVNDSDIWLYNRHDLCATKRLRDVAAPILHRQGKWRIFQMLMEFLKVLAEVEWKGIQVDEEYLDTFGSEWKAKREEALRSIEAAGFHCDPEEKQGYSSKELLAYFKRQKVKLPKTVKGNPSAAAANLEKIDHPVAKLILELREANKQYGTYYLGFKKTLVGGRYYPDYDLTATVSGRLGERFIQVMPRANTSGFKKCIRSKWSDGLLFAIDWSQLELRIIADVVAAVTGNAELANDLLGGLDIHAETLARFPFLPDRTRAKNANFSVFFGGKGWTLCHDYGFTKEQAEEFRYDLLDVRYQSVKAWHLETEKQTIMNGKVRMLTGRERHTDKFTEGYNGQIQGVGSDFNKIMTIKCYKRLDKEGLETHPIADVHDENIFDTPSKKEFDKARELCLNEYSRLNEYFYEYFGYELKMKYEGEMKVGKNLLEMEKVHG
jgi:DNA polymerase-1